MTYSLDGWTGRYGMPLEFLLSVHIATMAPDLSYQMATSFDTEVEILLHATENGTIDAAIAPKDNPQKKTYREKLVELNNSFFPDGWDWVNEMTLSPTEVKQIFDETDLESYTGDDANYSKYKCTGPPVWQDVAHEGPFPGGYTDDENGELKKVGFSDDIISIIQSSVKIDGEGTGELNISKQEYESLINEIREDFRVKEDDDEDKNISKEKGYYIEGQHDDIDDVKIRIYIIVSDNVGQMKCEVSIDYETHDESVATYCSQTAEEGNNSTVACDHCVAYVKAIYALLNDIDVENFKTYVPYINCVKDHWFRNVYFTAASINESGDTIVANDDEYEQKTGERWTLYELDDDGNYELYVYLKQEDGEYKTEFTEENGKWLVCRNVGKGKGDYKLSDDGITYEKSTGGEYKLQWKDSDKKYSEYDSSEDEFRVGKKAEQNTDIGSDYIAYEFGQSDNTWKPLEVNDDSPSAMQDLEGLGQKLYYKASYGTVKQVEDGVRGETNPIIKKLFLDDYYLYDGTQGTAALIQKAKQMAGSDNPDDFKKSFNDDQKIEADVTTTVHEGEEGKEERETTQHYTATIDQISGPISLSHNSLSAFSILENIHTLDAEYIYRDFKELIVELDYFDKEDLVEAEDEVMMFPISEVSALGWPVARYDKSEEFYGTLIHSAEDLRARRMETLVELKELLTQEEIEELDNVENNTTSEQVTNQPETSDNLLVQAAKDIYDYITAEGGYDYSQAKRASSFEASKTQKFYDCSSYVSWCLQLVGIFDDGELTSSGNIGTLEKLADYYHSGAPATLETGMILIYDGHVNIYDQNGMYYDGGEHGGIKYKTYNKKIEGYISIPNDKMKYNGVIGTTTGSSSTTAEFAGFEGGETVVAPVTGEVVEYGTTTRKNIEVQASKEKGNLVEEVDKVNDEVGFIKIRVLGSKEWKQSKSTEGCQYFTGVSKSSIQNAITGNAVDEDNASNWLETNYTEEQLQTLGYDYFWEEYNDAGIGDYILYIEGFDVSDIGVTGNKKDNLTTLSEYISNVGEDSELSNSYSTQYFVPNLLDDKREFELKIAEQAKEKAAYTISKDGKIYIKEGAVIGKTYSSDSDFIKEIKIEELETEETDNQNETQNNTVTDENNQDVNEIEENAGPYKVGNYLRVIFRDTGEQIVENVEDYIETSKGISKGIETDVPEELLFFLGVLEEGGWNGDMDLGDAYGVVVLNDGAGNTTAFGLTGAIANTGEVPNMYPDFGNHLASGRVPKKEAQDVFVLVMEAAREAVLNEINDQSFLTEPQLDALIDLYHASPEKCKEVCDLFNSNHTLTVQNFENHWGSNQNYAEILQQRAHNRGILATTGVYQRYNGSTPIAVIEFKSETPWTDFCNCTSNVDSFVNTLFEDKGGGT